MTNFPASNNNGGGAAKLLVTFTNAEASKHYFCRSGLGGGEIDHLCTLHGCHNNPCTCYVSNVVNGVVCFSNGKEVYVLNPATSDILTLPRSEGYDKFCQSNLNLSYFVYAFGFDPSRQQYKVVRVFGVPQSPGSALLHNQQCEVFTVNPDGEKQKEVKPKTVKKEVRKKHKGDKKEDEEEEEEEDERYVWRKDVSLPPCPYIFRGEGVYVNGSVYWLGVSSPGKDAIVCFDVESEMFRSIPVPFMLPHRPSLSYVRGRLAIQGIEKATGSSPTLGVWILEDIKEESKWNKNTVEIVDPKEQKGVKFHVLVGDDSTGDMVVMRSVIPERYEVVCLSGNKNTAAERTITLGGLPSWVDLQRGNNNKLNFRIHNYVESRVPLDPIVVKVKKLETKEASSRGGGYRRDSGCFSCGNIGHIARNCPNRVSRACFNCGDPGHFARDCSSNSGRGGGCYKCGGEGHLARYCTNSNGGGFRRPGGRGGARETKEDGGAADQAPQLPAVSGPAAKNTPPVQGQPQTQQFSRASQSVQRTHSGPAQSRPKTQAAQQPPPLQASQPCPNGGAQPCPTLPACQPAQETLIRIGEINVQVSI